MQMQITDKNIRDRFILCINELGLTLDDIAPRIGTHKAYLSALKKNETPKVPVLFIARFCLEFGYSAEYIVKGKGDKKSREPKTREERKIEVLEKRIDALIEIIGNLLNETLVFKAVWTDKTKELVKEAKKNVQ